MSGKLKLSLENLRVQSFETTVHPAEGDGTVQALCGVGTCGECSECTNCSECSICTECTHYTDYVPCGMTCFLFTGY